MDTRHVTGDEPSLNRITVSSFGSAKVIVFTAAALIPFVFDELSHEGRENLNVAVFYQPVEILLLVSLLDLCLLLRHQPKYIA